MRPSGPTADEALAAFMASAVRDGVKIGGLLRGLLRRSFFLTLRDALDEFGVPKNWRLKSLAMVECFE